MSRRNKQAREGGGRYRKEAELGWWMGGGVVVVVVDKATECSEQRNMCNEIFHLTLANSLESPPPCAADMLLAVCRVWCYRPQPPHNYSCFGRFEPGAEECLRCNENRFDIDKMDEWQTSSARA